MKVALITGSAGLVGSESARFFAAKGYHIVGIDNDMRKYFFGQEASVISNNDQLKKDLGDKYTFYEADIREHGPIEDIFKRHQPEIIIHSAAQPSHDWAAKEPYTDFSVNAGGTLGDARDRPQVCTQGHVYFYVDQQSLWRPAELFAAR
jgi:CDP-paratose 2-epimerase